MRTAALALAGYLATAACAGAVEFTRAPAFILPSPGPFRGGPPPADLRGYPQPEPAGRYRSPEPGWPPVGRVCFNQVEARDTIVSHRLSDPVRALRAGRSLGEALSARLCRWPQNDFVYEVHVLRRDGRVLRMFMNAQTGEPLAGPGPR
jgi:hypothetical protein